MDLDVMQKINLKGTIEELDKTVKRSCERINQINESQIDTTEKNNGWILSSDRTTRELAEQEKIIESLYHYRSLLVTEIQKL